MERETRDMLLWIKLESQVLEGSAEKAASGVLAKFVCSRIYVRCGAILAVALLD